MAGLFSNIKLTDPSVIMSLVIVATVVVKVILIMFPQLVSVLRDLENLSGFQFADLFNSGGVFDIILSALILGGIAALIGFNIFKSKSKR